MSGGVGCSFVSSSSPPQESNPVKKDWIIEALEAKHKKIKTEQQEERAELEKVLLPIYAQLAQDMSFPESKYLEIVKGLECVVVNLNEDEDDIDICFKINIDTNGTSQWFILDEIRTGYYRAYSSLRALGDNYKDYSVLIDKEFKRNVSKIYNQICLVWNERHPTLPVRVIVYGKDDVQLQKASIKKKE